MTSFKPGTGQPTTTHAWPTAMNFANFCLLGSFRFFFSHLLLIYMKCDTNSRSDFTLWFRYLFFALVWLLRSTRHHLWRISRGFSSFKSAQRATGLDTLQPACNHAIFARDKYLAFLFCILSSHISTTFAYKKKLLIIPSSTVWSNMLAPCSTIADILK